MDSTSLLIAFLSLAPKLILAIRFLSQYLAGVFFRPPALNPKVTTTSGNAELSIASLSHQISELSSQISSYISASAQSEPNFSPSSTSVPTTPEYESLRASLNDAALDLLRLVNGPKSTLRTFCFSHYDLSALQVAVDRGFFRHVPLPVGFPGKEIEGREDDGIDVAKIAEKAEMDEDRTARLLRLLTTHRTFEEVGGGSGRFRHTAMSAVMARDKDFHALVHMQ
jgi:hypothetical protein